MQNRSALLRVQTYLKNKKLSVTDDTIYVAVLAQRKETKRKARLVLKKKKRSGEKLNVRLFFFFTLFPVVDC